MRRTRPTCSEVWLERQAACQHREERLELLRATQRHRQELLLQEQPDQPVLPVLQVLEPEQVLLLVELEPLTCPP